MRAIRLGIGIEVVGELYAGSLAAQILPVSILTFVGHTNFDSVFV